MKDFKNLKKNIKKYPEDPSSQYKREDAGKPHLEKDVDSLFMRETMKGLRFFSDSITVKADPDGMVIPNSVPRAIINNQNKIIDGKYGEKENLFGNVLQSVTTSNNSKFLNYIDAMVGKLEINYLNIDFTGKTKAAINQMRGTVQEAVSKAYSETFINLPFFNLTVDSDVGIDTTDGAGKMLATALTYQTILLNVAGIFNKYNQLHACRKLLLDMEWNRNAPSVTAYYGLLNKASFKAQFQAISTNIWGEYFDKNWYLQTNTLSALLSAKSDSITDPLMEIMAVTHIPNLKLSLKSGDTIITLFDTKQKFKIKDQPGDFTMSEVFNKLISELSPVLTLEDIRKDHDMKVKFNGISYMLDTVVKILDYFKQGFETFRTVLDVMNRVGINGWMKGPSFELLNDDSYKPMYNLIVEDIIKAKVCSATIMTLDETTRRWKFYSLWDKYFGINKFDRFSGGSFITFSIRSLSVPANVEPSDTILMVPRMFNIKSIDSSNNTLKAIDRKGNDYYINGTKIDKIESHYVLSRLDLLGLDPKYDFSIPTIKVGETTATPDQVSAATYLINNTFKIGIINYNDTTNVSHSDVELSSDILGLVDIQCDNVNNDMITWIAQNAPFRTQTPIKSIELGFKQ